jgi:hypothetical protein
VALLDFLNFPFAGHAPKLQRRSGQNNVQRLQNILNVIGDGNPI